jgi:phosphoribosylformimino-5-aminoimidazole carboxamide ribotide isomerase
VERRIDGAAQLGERIMEVIPAIDIRGGKAVRLFQGDYDRETVFNDSPVDAAQRWLDIGATRLHVVDLDGAKTGEQVNIDLVERIAAISNVPVQLGGAIRTVQAAQRAMDVGVGRVIVGTAALEGEEFVQDLCDRIGSERVVAGVDARNGFVAVRGWTEESGTPVHDLVARMEETGVSRIIYTDISRDGTRTEPNFQQVDELLVATRLKMLVAGGVSRIDHIRRLAKMGVEGAIVGTAAYTGVIDMREAIEEQKSRA